MNILFISISSIGHMSKHSISQDLLRELNRNGHNIYVVCSLDANDDAQTNVSVEENCTVLRVKTGKNKMANPIQKALTMMMLPKQYIKEIKRHFSDVKFDLVLYPTPPITHAETVAFIKKRDGAKSYLMLKDIFPQNAVDIGMMTKNGLKGLAYKNFRRKEKKLYELSDRIGCMSPANVDYLLKHNPEVDPKKVEIFPNSIEIVDFSVTDEEALSIRRKYGIPEDKKVFVYGGNLGKPQGVPFLIDCMRKVSDIKDAFFLIVGNGTEFGKIEAFVNSEKPENVKLLKRLPKEDYDKMICSCDVGLIFLDHRFTIPNFPSRLLAYLQAKLPVIAATDPNTDVGKVIEDGKFGWWCESNDADKFAELVKEALNSDFPQMKNNAYEYLIANYQVKDTAKIIMKAFDNCDCK